MDLVDTHCHIHEILGNKDDEYAVAAKWHKAGVTDADQVIADAVKDGVAQLICVGCTVEDSQLAVQFVQQRSNVWASIGIHPHEASRYVRSHASLETFAAMVTEPKVVAVGECGLDFFYNHSPKEDQEAMLRFQLELAQQHQLPMIFHVRDAFEDFWPIFDAYPGVRGVIHSFTATGTELAQAIERGLYIGLNGIVTFSKDEAQLAAAKAVPLDKLVLETDAPFLTPVPHRGTICTPRYVRLTAEYLSSLRGEPLEEIARATTDNARNLFGLR